MVQNNQFMSIDNDIKPNFIDQQTQRYKIWKSSEKFEFISYTVGPEFSGLPLEYNEQTSYDGGKTYEEEEGNLLFNLLFHMSNEKVDHKFEA
jgi:hypothetical protein